MKLDPLGQGVAENLKKLILFVAVLLVALLLKAFYRANEQDAKSNRIGSFVSRPTLNAARVGRINLIR